MHSNEKMQILIVDDVQINREIFVELLQDQYAPLQAENGFQAVELIEKHPDTIALILLDIMMPGLDGYGVLEQLQAMNLTGIIPVIIISAAEDPEAVEKAYELGATDFISRSTDPTILNKRIFNYIQLFGRQKTSFNEVATQNHRLKTLDELTDCNNLAAFRQQAEQILLNNPQQTYALWYSNIKQFKLINNHFGYDVGDYVIKFWAKCIQLEQQEGETFGRMSGDRFVSLTRCENLETLEKRFWNRVTAVQTCLKKQDLDYDIDINTGIYLIQPGEPDKLSMNLMLDRATLAQQSVSQKNGSHFCIYDDKMLDSQLRRSEISKHLDKALQTGEVMAYFQPQFDFSLRAVSGAEALCRWKHSTLGWLSPAEFIPVLEQSNQIYQLDCFIWREACRALAQLRSKGILTPISVNVSRADIQEDSLIQVLQGYIQEFGLSCADLHLEVTESAYMEDSQQLKQMVHTLQSMGFCVEMDDFGSGYSSLNTLKDLPVNILKLDAYFIRDSISDLRGSAILSTVVGMAQRLKLPIIAEGIETMEQAQSLLDMGCQWMQGYYFARPMPMKDFLELMDTTPNSGAHHDLSGAVLDPLSRARQAIQEFSALLKQIVSSNTCGIFAYSLPDRRTIQVNREAYRLMGWEEWEENLEINPYSRLPERMVPEDRAAIALAAQEMKAPGDQFSIPYRLQKDGNVYLKVNLTSKYLEMPSGKHVILSILSDITNKDS